MNERPERPRAGLAAPAAISSGTGVWDPRLTDDFLERLRQAGDEEERGVRGVTQLGVLAGGMLGWAFLPGTPMFLLGGAAAWMAASALSRRSYRARAMARFQPPIPWQTVRVLDRRSRIRELDEPEARTHQAIPHLEQIERFRRSLLAHLQDADPPEAEHPPAPR